MDDLGEQIVKAVRAYPGLTLYRLALLLDVDERALDGVINKLASEARLTSRTQRSSVRWYVPEAPADQGPPSDPITPGMRAWEVLVLTSTRAGGITPHGIAAHTRMDAGYGQKMLLRLEAEQLVRRCGPERRWVVTQKGRDLLARQHANRELPPK